MKVKEKTNIMKMIDVLIKLANGEIKNNTVLDVIDDEGIIINEF